ncbi:MAG: phosphoribosylanthranilate isomerase [Bacteroidales bacterium]|nr:phosphoribosylanthranilate isomerase [Bacteroidales bacterium]
MIQIKVCGMRDPDNVRQIIQAGPDIIGFIFYPGSERYAGNMLREDIHKLVPQHIVKAGVFVNEDLSRIMSIAKQISLQLIQLHGDEPPEECRTLKQEGLKIIKAFGIGAGFQMDEMKPYLQVCDYFLFDTRSERFGGSGRKFDWDILGSYRFQKPFFLSGGISAEDIPALKNIVCPFFYGVDINSKFERETGIKDISKVAHFIRQIKEE